MTMEKIPLMRPNINEKDIEEVVAVLRSGMLVQGKKVAELESKTIQLTKANYCSAVSNGTASLQLALLALGVGAGDEVIVPGFSYIATANVVELVKATCVFVDINLDTFTINVDQIESAITSKTKAIIPVHEFGLCADMYRIMEIAKKYNLFVIEDAACALGAKIEGKMAGTFGDFGSFSLHPRKAITSGEGGLLTTHSQELDIQIKILRNHGIMPDELPLNFVDAGYNYRMTDFQAALVNSQFNRINQILSIKQDYAKFYSENINSHYLVLPSVPVDYVHTWQTFHILLNSSKNREALILFMKDAGIYTNYGAQCIPAMSYYQKKYKLDFLEKYPHSWAAYTQGLAIPLYETLTEDQLHYIVHVINKFETNAY